MTAAIDHPPLDRLQNWFLAAITHPDGVRSGVISAEACRHIEVAEGAESVLTRSQALPALDRLAVYGQAYFARLLDVLREEYPVLKKTLGDELFDAFAAEYLQKYPPRSYTLFDLGTRFPQFLRETRPAEESADTGPDWPDFLIDLASWELAFNEVFDGPGTEGRAPLDVAAIAAVSPDRLPDARLVAAPCLRVLSLKYPVHNYFAAVRRNEDAPHPEPAETFLALTRQQYVVRHYELSKPAYVLLAALLDGKALGAAIDEAARHDSATELEPRLTAWFSDWAARGFFLGIVASSDGDTTEDRHTREP